GRVIQEHVKKPLAEELLFGKLSKGGAVLVDIEDDAVIFRYPEDGDDKKHVKKNPEMVEG
ncbi:MAG TPA: hypothetical protein DCY62_06800, partial [Thalassospira sp.]|nr:hypothetical protein [Thalassospira sp.]